MAVINPPAYIQANTVNHPARNFRIGIGAPWMTTGGLNIPRSGVVAGRGGELSVGQTGGGAMSVTVQPGVAVINTGSFSNHHGAWIAGTDSTALVVTIATADTTNPRIDIIVAKVEDAEYTGSVNTWSIVAVTGTPAGSPSPPAAPNNSITLAEVSVPANDTSITTGQITDKRPFAVGVGGVLPVLSTGRPTSPQKGQPIFETDTSKVYFYDGTTWQQALVLRSGNDIDSAVTFGSDISVVGNLSVTGIGAMTFIRKTADESVASSTTLQNDDHFTFTLAATATYWIQGMLMLDAGQTGDFKSDWTGPAGTVVSIAWLGDSIGTAGGSNEISHALQNALTDVVAFGGAQSGGGTIRPIQFQGTIRTTGTSGTLQWRFAQNSSTVTPTIIKANSAMELHRRA